MHEPARQRARELANTAAFPSAQRERKKLGALFEEMKNLIGLRRLRLRRMKFVREQFFLAVPTENSVRTENAEVPSIHEILVRSR
jgi:hypothetical protein